MNYSKTKMIRPLAELKERLVTRSNFWETTYDDRSIGEWACALEAARLGATRSGLSRKPAGAMKTGAVARRLNAVVTPTKPYKELRYQRSPLDGHHVPVVNKDMLTRLRSWLCVVCAKWQRFAGHVHSRKVIVGAQVRTVVAHRHSGSHAWRGVHMLR